MSEGSTSDMSDSDQPKPKKGKMSEEVNEFMKCPGPKIHHQRDIHRQMGHLTFKQENINNSFSVSKQPSVSMLHAARMSMLNRIKRVGEGGPPKAHTYPPHQNTQAKSKERKIRSKKIIPQVTFNLTNGG